MARFVHIADSRAIAAIRRNGLKASRCRDGRRGVFCVPVIPDHARTYQWARELRRWEARAYVAVVFVLPDAERVHIGHYRGDTAEVTAAEASAFFRDAEDPFGYEVLALRSIDPGEIRTVRPAPRITGWRVFPEAKGQRPFWPQPGSRNAARLRRSIEAWAAGPWG